MMTRRKAAVLKEEKRQKAKTVVEFDVNTRGSSTAESDKSHIDISVSRESKTDPFDVQIDLKD